MFEPQISVTSLKIISKEVVPAMRWSFRFHGQNLHGKSQIKQHSEKLGLILNSHHQRGCSRKRNRRLSQMKDTPLKSYWAIFSVGPQKGRRKESTGKGQREPRSENLKHGAPIKGPERNINYTLTFSRETKEACIPPCIGVVLRPLQPLQKSPTLSAEHRLKTPCCQLIFIKTVSVSRLGFTN